MEQRELAEQKRRQDELETRMLKATIKIQSWWRGTMVCVLPALLTKTVSVY